MFAGCARDRRLTFAPLRGSVRKQVVLVEAGVVQRLFAESEIKPLY